jgi:hypothetical protein
LNDHFKKMAARLGLFGGAVLVLLGLVLAWAALTGMEGGGDWAYFTILLVLGCCMMAQAVGLWIEVGSGGPTRGLDGAMLAVQGVTAACLAWMALNVDRIQVVNISNGQVHYTGVPEEVATGIALLMLLTLYDVIVRLRRRTERATLNNPPGLTGPDS